MPGQVAAFAGDLGALYVSAFAYEQEVTPLAGREADFLAQFTAWLKSLPADRFPSILALANELVAGSSDDRFEWGLDVLVRGLASYLDVPPDSHARWPSGG
jgi:hypothetical protein